MTKKPFKKKIKISPGFVKAFNEAATGKKLYCLYDKDKKCTCAEGNPCKELSR